MKVLITGGQGFIGTYVVENLIAKGHEVAIFDRVQRWSLPEGSNFYLGDIRDKEAIQEAIYKCDGVINLAGILGTSETVQNPKPSVHTNIIGALNVFESCRPCSMFPDGIPAVQIAVGNSFMNNSYSITKSVAERFALMFNKECGTRIAVVRILNAYGPRQKEKPVRKIMPNFVIPAIKKKPIDIYGDGEQVMDMIYVEDVAEILVRALLNDHKCYSKVLEGGTGRSTTVNQISEIVKRAAGSKEANRYIPMRAGEIPGSTVLGDPSTLKPLGMGHRDLVSLEDGVKRTVQYYEDTHL